MVAANPLIDCGSTSSPYRVRITCQASSSPLVARPTAPTKIAARVVVARFVATNHQSIEYKDRLPYDISSRARDCANALVAPYSVPTRAKRLTVQATVSGTVDMTDANPCSPIAGKSNTMKEGKLPGSRVSAVT